MKNFNRDLNTQFFYDKIISNRHTRNDFERISVNFFCKDQKIKLPKTEYTNISDSFGYDHTEKIHYLNESGYIFFDDEEISLLPLIYVDALHVNSYAIIPIKPEPDEENNLFTLNKNLIIEDLNQKQFKVENFNIKESAEQIMKCYEENDGGKVFICSGTMPKPSTPDSLTLIESEDLLNVNNLNNSWGNDFLLYEEINFFKKVKKGEIIGSYTPRKQGEKGTSVFGHPVDYGEIRGSKVGVGLKILDQKDVVVEYDGFLKIGINGIYRIRNTKLIEGNLEKDLIIDDDIDVIVNKNVTSGKIIKTKGNVTIKGNVEEGRIECDGELIVTGGVTRKSKLYGKKDMEIQFISFSEVKTEGSIRVRKYIIDSHVESAKDVLVKFKKNGQISGGHIKLTRRMEANILGVPSGKETIIEITTPKGDYEILNEKILEKLENNRQFIAKLSKTLGPVFLANPINYMKKLPPNKIDKIKPYYLQFKKLLLEIKELEAKLPQILEKKKEEKKITENQTYIVINEEVFDNVLIKINDIEYRTKNSISFACLFQQSYNSITRKPFTEKKDDGKKI